MAKWRTSNKIWSRTKQLETKQETKEIAIVVFHSSFLHRHSIYTSFWSELCINAHCAVSYFYIVNEYLVFHKHFHNNIKNWKMPNESGWWYFLFSFILIRHWLPCCVRFFLFCVSLDNRKWYGAFCSLVVIALCLFIHTENGCTKSTASFINIYSFDSASLHRIIHA